MLHSSWVQALVLKPAEPVLVSLFSWAVLRGPQKVVAMAGRAGRLLWRVLLLPEVPLALPRWGHKQEMGMSCL